MSMLQLIGSVVNVLEAPKGTNKEGVEYGGFHQVQLMCEEDLANGEKRFQLFTMRTDRPHEFRDLIGSTISVPVGAFARGNSLHFYMAKSGTPNPV